MTDLYPDPVEPPPPPVVPPPMICTRFSDWNKELGVAIGLEAHRVLCSDCGILLAVNKPRLDEIKAKKWRAVCAGCANGKDEIPD